MKYKILSIIAFGALLATAASAQTTDEELRAHPEFTNSNYLLYPEPANVKYTRAPAGYKPFYLSHYGRHGSRYSHSDEDYIYLFGTLSKADSLGKLTEVGKQALAYTHVLLTKAGPRAGDLTQVGVKQHQGIAKRMAKNFPEIFTPKNAKVTPHIKAYASTSGRCIVSMSAFLSEFRTHFPKDEIEMVSGKGYMKFICPFDWGKLEYSQLKTYTDESGKLWTQVNPAPFMEKLFNDKAYVAKNIDASKFYNRFIEIASQNPGLDESVLQDIATESKVPAESFLNLFSTEEKITRWKAQNSWWYSLLGTSPLINRNDGINFGKAILQNIIDEADTVIAADTMKTTAKGVVSSKDAADVKGAAANVKGTASAKGPAADVKGAAASAAKNAASAAKNVAENSPVVATLRFGHDTGLLPLAGLMQLDVAKAKVSDLSKLHEQWTDFRVIPMAGNMQLVFYKATAKGAAKGAAAKPILVKMLYNEIEQTLPVPCGIAQTNAEAADAKSSAETATQPAAKSAAKPEKMDCPAAPYYRWDDFREFYLKLAK